MPQAPVATPAVADNSAFGGPSAAQAAAANAAIAKAAPLITTSSSSRSVVANNVATLNGAINNVAASNAQGPASPSNPIATPTGKTDGPTAPVTNTPVAKTNTAATAYTPPATATQTQLPGGATGYYTPANGSTPESMTDSNGNPLTYSQSVGGWIDPTTGQAPVASSTSGANGTTTDTNSSDVNSAVSGLPPSLQKLYADNLTNLQGQQTYAKSVLAQAQATLTNDPAATAAIAAIGAKYDILINAMNLKNTQVLGQAKSSTAAFGGLGVMSTNFLSDQMDAATSRIATLTTEKTNAMIAAQAAYGKEDLDAFNTAMDNYNKTITDMNTTLMDLNDAADKAVTQQQAAARLALDTNNAQVSNDQKQSSNIAQALATQLSAAGIDPGSYDYSSIAKAHGITDPAVLAAAVQSQITSNAKDALTAANTQDEIANRDTNTQIAIAKANKDLATPSGTEADRTQASITAGQSNFTPGAKLPDGTPVIDDHGYATPAAWKTLIASAPANGLTRQQFIDNYGQYIYIGKDGVISPAYGLTGAEMKKISTIAPDYSQ